MINATIIETPNLNTKEVRERFRRWFDKAAKVAGLTLKWNHDKRWMTGKDGHHGVRWN